MTVTRPNLNIISSFLPKEDGWSSAMNANLDAIDAAAAVSVSAYGAVGDGVTDDTTAFNNAFAALPAVAAGTPAGGIILLTRGKKYLISSTLDFTSKPVIIWGFGAQGDHNSPYLGIGAATLIKKASMSTPLLKLGEFRSGMMNVAVVGQVGNTGDGVQLLGHSNFLTNVSIMLMGGVGLNIGADTTNNCNLFRLDHVACRANVGTGCYIASDDGAGGPNTNGGVAILLSCDENGAKGLHLAKASKNIFVGFHSEANIGEGIYFTGNSDKNVFIGGDQEGNGAGTEINVTTSGCQDNAFLFVGRQGALTQAADTHTIEFSPTAFSLPQATLGEILSNGPQGGNFSGTNEQHIQLYGDLNARLRMGWKQSGAPTTALVAAQVVADLNTLHLVSRDISTGRVRLAAGGGLTSYLVLDPNNAKVETTENVKLVPSTNLKGFLEIGELSSDPANGPANTCRIFVKDNGAGKTQLWVRFGSGAVVGPLATEP